MRRTQNKESLLIKLCLICLLLVSFSVSAVSFDDGQEAYDQHHYQEAFAIWQKVVDSNTRISDIFDLENVNTEQKSLAQYAIAMLYWQGKGVRQSYVNASYWLSQAAENGHKEAAFKLATVYVEGLAGVTNLRKGAEWMSVAARGGVPGAQYKLGLMYLNGDGLDVDKGRATYWLRQAQASGVKDAGKMLLSFAVDGPLDAPAHSGDIADSSPNWIVHPPLLLAKDAQGVSEAPLTRGSDKSAQASALRHTDQSSQTENLRPYAIQLAATANLTQAKKMAEQYASTMDLKLFSKRVKQQDWYVLLDCCFSTRTEAGQRLSALPAALLAKKPFIISTSAVSPIRRGQFKPD